MTAGQRVRLILSLGVLNLVLATIALGLGGFQLQQQASTVRPTGPLAVLPTPAPGGESAAPTVPPATPVPTSPAGGSPSAEPSPSGSPEIASPSPSAAPTASSTALAALPPPVITPAPTAAATPVVTPRPTPRVTPAPTPRVTPTPKPVSSTPKPPKTTKAKAPCPAAGAPPPGHNKSDAAGIRPCAGGKGKHDNGVIFVFPLIAGTAAWATRSERLRRRARGR